MLLDILLNKFSFSGVLKNIEMQESSAWHF
jgi:hypothetical protein